MSVTRLDFGIFIAPFHPVGENPTLALQRDFELIEWLDRLGYDEAWIGEHHSAGYELIAWYGVFAPGKTPAHIVQRLYAEIRRIIALPDIKSRFTAMGTETADVPPAEFQRIYLAELQRWAKFVRDTGLKLD